MNKIFTKSDIPDIVESFNKHIKKIVKILDNVLINNITYDTLKRRMGIAMNETPIFLLQTGGNEIFKKKEFIINNTLDELFNKDITYYTNTVNISEDLKNDINDKEIDNLFNMVKDCWNSFNLKEKNYINKIFKVLLSDYSKYKSINQ